LSKSDKRTFCLQYCFIIKALIQAQTALKGDQITLDLIAAALMRVAVGLVVVETKHISIHLPVHFPSLPAVHLVVVAQEPMVHSQGHLHPQPQA
jgi:hypothetical protein